MCDLCRRDENKKKHKMWSECRELFLIEVWEGGGFILSHVGM